MVYNCSQMMSIIEKAGHIIESTEVEIGHIKFYCHDKEQPLNRFFITIKEK